MDDENLRRAESQFRVAPQSTAHAARYLSALERRYNLGVLNLLDQPTAANWKALQPALSGLAVEPELNDRLDLVSSVIRTLLQNWPTRLRPNIVLLDETSKSLEFRSQFIRDLRMNIRGCADIELFGATIKCCDSDIDFSAKLSPDLTRFLPVQDFLDFSGEGLDVELFTTLLNCPDLDKACSLSLTTDFASEQLSLATLARNYRQLKHLTIDIPRLSSRRKQELARRFFAEHSLESVHFANRDNRIISAREWLNWPFDVIQSKSLKFDAGRGVLPRLNLLRQDCELIELTVPISERSDLKHLERLITVHPNLKINLRCTRALTLDSIQRPLLQSSFLQNAIQSVTVAIRRQADLKPLAKLPNLKRVQCLLFSPRLATRVPQFVCDQFEQDGTLELDIQYEDQFESKISLGYTVSRNSLLLTDIAVESRRFKDVPLSLLEKSLTAGTNQLRSLVFHYVHQANNAMIPADLNRYMSRFQKIASIDVRGIIRDSNDLNKFLSTEPVKTCRHLSLGFTQAKIAAIENWNCVELKDLERLDLDYNLPGLDIDEAAFINAPNLPSLLYVNPPGEEWSQSP